MCAMPSQESCLKQAERCEQDNKNSVENPKFSWIYEMIVHLTDYFKRKYGHKMIFNYILIRMIKVPQLKKRVQIFWYCAHSIVYL